MYSVWYLTMNMISINYIWSYIHYTLRFMCLLSLSAQLKELLTEFDRQWADFEFQ